MIWTEQTIHLIGATVFLALTMMGYFFSVLSINTKLDTPIFYNIATRIACLIFFLILAQVISGSLLVIGKHYSFKTRWIDAAYLLIIMCLVPLINICRLLIYSKDHRPEKSHIWQLHVSYLTIMVITIIIMHDAICKSSLL